MFFDDDYYRYGPGYSYWDSWGDYQALHVLPICNKVYELLDIEKDRNSGMMEFTLINIAKSKVGEERTALRSLDELQKVLKNYHRKIAILSLSFLEIDTKFMEFFRSMDPICWTGLIFFCDIRCSEQNFNELLGGTIFKPSALQFRGIDDIKMDFGHAIRTLPAMKNIKEFLLMKSDSQPSKTFNSDAIVELAHSDYNPPSAYTNVPTYREFKLKQSNPFHILDKHNYLYELARQPGRCIHVYLHYLDGIGLEKFVDKFIKIFVNATERRTYHLVISCLPKTPSPKMKIKMNGLGEQLQIWTHGISSDFSGQFKSVYVARF